MQHSQVGHETLSDVLRQLRKDVERGLLEGLGQGFGVQGFEFRVEG